MATLMVSTASMANVALREPAAWHKMLHGMATTITNARLVLAAANVKIAKAINPNNDQFMPPVNSRPPDLSAPTMSQ